MHVRIVPFIVVLSALALVAGACSRTIGAQTGPALAPQMTAIASSVPAASEAEHAEGALRLAPETRTDARASVTVEVTPAGGTADTLIFDVAMNTHSVELEYDMTKIATLRDDQDRKYDVKSWDGPPGGHHREGSLTFAVPDGAAPESLELNLSSIGGAPSRLFKWDISQEATK